MFERFTDKASEAVMLAQQEAHRLGSKTVGCEHLLLGLIRQGSGGAAFVLRSNTIDLAVYRANVEAITDKGKDFSKSDLPWYEKTFAIKPLISTTKVNFSEEAKAAMKLSSEFAKRSNATVIDTEHLLIGILEMPDSIAVKALRQRGADLAKIKEELIIKAANSALELEHTSAKPTSFVNDDDRAKSVRKLTGLTQNVLKSELIFLLIASAVIYWLFPHLPGLIFSGKLVDALILVLMILFCKWIIIGPLVAIGLVLIMLTPWRSRLSKFGDKLRNEMEMENKPGHFGIRLLVQPVMIFAVSLCLLLVISMLAPNMIRSDSWYGLPIAATVIATVIGIFPVKKLLGNQNG